MQVENIFIQAHNAGNAAVAQLNVTPMIVSQKINPLDDNSDTIRQWIVDDGVCGFASVIIKPANSKFAKYLKSLGIANKTYGGGCVMSIHAFNQSLEKKEAYAYAFSNVLRDYGINSYVESRMD